MILVYTACSRYLSEETRYCTRWQTLTCTLCTAVEASRDGRHGCDAHLVPWSERSERCPSAERPEVLASLHIPEYDLGLS